MQVEATDSSLREGIEAMGVKDSEKPAAVQKGDEKEEEEEGSREQQDTEMTAATEEHTTSKKETGTLQ